MRFISLDNIQKLSLLKIFSRFTRDFFSMDYPSLWCLPGLICPMVWHRTLLLCSLFISLRETESKLGYLIELCMFVVYTLLVPSNWRSVFRVFGDELEVWFVRESDNKEKGDTKMLNLIFKLEVKRTTPRGTWTKPEEWTRWRDTGSTSEVLDLIRH